MNTLSAATRKRLLAKAVRKTPLKPTPRSVVFALPGDPPRTTHHDKAIDTRGRRPRVYDKPALRQAREWYDNRLVTNTNHTPFSTCCLFVWIGFLATKSHRPSTYWDDKPDLDNMLKVMTDALVRAGWIADDKEVVGLVATKIAVARNPGILIRVTAPDAVDLDAHVLGDADPLIKINEEEAP